MTSDEMIRKVAGVIDGILSADPQVAREMFGDEPDRIARALADEGLLAPAPTPVPWWRVIGPDEGVWCETSSESEARQKARPGDTLQQLWETPPVGQWVTKRETL